MKRAMPEIDLAKCTGCGDCVEQCPTSAVAVVNNKVTIVRLDDCNYCADCEIFCPPGAIRCPFEIVLAKTKPPKPTRKVIGKK